MAGRKRGERLGGLLTERQIQILNLRSGNLTQEETAIRLGISRQDVSILEKRALRNINIAADTLQMAENIGILRRTRIEGGMHILDVAKRILEFADAEGIRLKSTALGVMTLIQAAASTYLDNGVVTVALETVLLPDGRVSISTLP